MAFNDPRHWPYGSVSDGFDHSTARSAIQDLIGTPRRIAVTGGVATKTNFGISSGIFSGSPIPNSMPMSGSFLNSNEKPLPSHLWFADPNATPYHALRGMTLQQWHWDINMPFHGYRPPAEVSGKFTSKNHLDMESSSISGSGTSRGFDESEEKEDDSDNVSYSDEISSRDSNSESRSDRDSHSNSESISESVSGSDSESNSNSDSGNWTMSERGSDEVQDQFDSSNDESDYSSNVSDTGDSVSDNYFGDYSDKDDEEPKEYSEKRSQDSSYDADIKSIEYLLCMSMAKSMADDETTDIEELPAEDLTEYKNAMIRAWLLTLPEEADIEDGSVDIWALEFGKRKRTPRRMVVSQMR